MDRTEFRAELHRLRAIGERKRQDAIATRRPLAALRGQLVMMAAEGLLDDELDWVEAVMQVDQIVAGLQQAEAG
jgi:hypothetical protein